MTERLWQAIRCGLVLGLFPGCHANQTTLQQPEGASSAAPSGMASAAPPPAAQPEVADTAPGNGAAPGARKSMIDYFLPIPVDAPLTSDTWGGPGVLPRDVHNGLESQTNEYFYWDGKVIRGDDAKYHLFASRWPKAWGFSQWGKSVVVHAVSDSLLGPYVDRGKIYTRNGGKGHNVAGLPLPDGTFLLYTSDTTPGDLYAAPSLDGPWTFRAPMDIDTNGQKMREPRYLTSNISIVVRPDQTLLATQRLGQIMVGTKDPLGTFVVQGPSVWPSVPGLDNSRAEDPVIWHSGGCYHITVNWWDSRVAHHLKSRDGVTDWQDMGVAYDPRADFIRYTDGTVNHWHNLERPNVVMEDGHVVAFTFAATDFDKHQIEGSDNHGSKIIVVPFDGEAFDRDYGCDP